MSSNSFSNHLLKKCNFSPPNMGVFGNLSCAFAVGWRAESEHSGALAPVLIWVLARLAAPLPLHGFSSQPLGRFSLPCFCDGPPVSWICLCFLQYFSWGHYLGAYFCFVATNVFWIGSGFRCLRWKSGFCRICESTPPNFGPSSIALKKSDVIVIPDPLNRNFMFFNSFWELLNIFLLLVIWTFLFNFDALYFFSHSFYYTFNLGTPDFLIWGNFLEKK